MKRFYFDTETTGFPAKAGTPLDKCPFVVQIAAILVDDEYGEVASLSTIIKPDGWTIPENVAEIHGITTEKAEAFGIPAKVAMAAFSQICRQADEVIAHNISFDLKIVSYEIERAAAPNVIADKVHFCTMAATTDICKLPGNYGKYKWPKLIEAHQHFFNEGFDGAHDALVDVRACARIHKHLIQNNLVNP